MTMSFTGSDVGALGPQSVVPVWVGLGIAHLPEEGSKLLGLDFEASKPHVTCSLCFLLVT